MKLDYYNRTHKGLSYSRQLTLHQCPRKYELDAKYSIKGHITSVTFAYGHSVGAAVQSTLSGQSFNRTIIDTVLNYSHQEDDEGTENERKAKKSLWFSLLAAKEFHQKYNAGVYSFLDGWEVAKFTDPNTGEIVDAVELTFVLEIANGYSFEGHIDLVLYHPKKNRYMVVELKTTGFTSIDEATYKNSAQALGYGMVLDLIAQNLKASASYDVLYLVYKSRSFELVPLLFTKTPAHRTKWLSSLMTDVQMVELYENNGYPHHGESCYDFFRQCEYFQQCHMTDETLLRMYGTATDADLVDDGDSDKYAVMLEPTFMFTIDELMERQETLIQMATSTDTVDGGDVDLLLDVVSHT